MSVSDITVSDLTSIGDVNGVKLAWTYSDPRNGMLPNIALDMVEVWAATANDRAHASFAKVGEGITDFLHAGLARGANYFYWGRARDNIGGLGPFHPSGATSGVVGTEVSGDVLIASDGYWKHPSGLIEQWGQKNLSGGGGTVTFPLEFPNLCFQVIALPFIGADATTLYAIKTISFNTITAELQGNKVTDGGAVTTAVITALWRAIGY